MWEVIVVVGGKLVVSWLVRTVVVGRAPLSCGVIREDKC